MARAQTKGMDRTRPVVLAVDDSEEILAFVEAVLRDSYDMEFASNGAMGLTKALASPPDLVITDIMMPNGSGEDLIKGLRAEPSLDHIPILVLTGKRDDALGAKLLRAGAQDYCLKPLSQEELSARVWNLLQLKLVRDLLEAEVESKSSNLQELVRESSHQRNQLRKLAQQLQTVQEEERNRISREIHDELGQDLTLLKLRLFELATQLEAGSSAHAPTVRSLTDDVTNMLKVARRLAYELRPSILQDFGLHEAISSLVRDFATKTGILCKLTAPPLDGVASEHATVLFRVLQESLTNVARHAQAKTTAVTLVIAPGEIEMTVADDGIGFAPATWESTSSLGLVGMRERVLSVNGKFAIGRGAPRGSCLKVLIPTASPGDL